MNKLLSILLVVVLSGCAIATQKITPEMYMKVYNYPELQEETTSSIGDTLVDHSYRYVGEGVSIQDDIVFKKIGVFTFYAGNYFRYSNYQGNKCYGPLTGHLIDIIGFRQNIGGGQFCVKNKNTAVLIYGEWELPVQVKFKVQDLQSQMKDKNFKQQFIYNGKVDNAIKFIYREFSGNVARGSFQQDLQYDLNESDIIGFKELRLKVIKATNQSITYKVLNNFSVKDYE